MAFKTLTYLQSCKYPITSAQFAERVGITRRTALRYLQAACDVPETNVYAEFGPRRDSQGVELYFTYRRPDVRR